jgi:hypothetical protein
MVEVATDLDGVVAVAVEAEPLTCSESEGCRSWTWILTC